MGSDSRVAVAIPAYNAERWLGEALESVLTQERCQEIVIVDDGSSDETAAVAAAYGRSVRLVRQAHSGIGAARNRALACTDADIVAFLDADDRFTARGLDTRVALLDARPDCELVFGHIRRFRALAGAQPVPAGPLQPGVLSGAMVVRRSLLERVGPFEDVSVGEALHWLLRARELRAAEVTVPDHVLWRRVHGENTTIRQRDEYGEYARALKASLDRRRAAAGVAYPFGD